MNVIPVESATLASVGYERDGGMLQLEFRSRAVYLYYAVPAEVHQALLAAESKGAYFNRAIRGRYQFVRIKPPAEGVADQASLESQGSAAWPAR